MNVAAIREPCRRIRGAALATALGAVLALVGPGHSFAQSDFFLYGQGGAHLLGQVAPTTADTTFSSSGPVGLLGDNPWEDIATWTGRFAIRSPVFVMSVSDLHVWLGLLTSADTTAAFDLEADVWVKSVGSEPTRVGHGIKRCIAGLPHGAGLAQETVVPFTSTRAAFDAGTESIFLKLRARIGTNARDRRCTGSGFGQARAAGLRVYHGSTAQPSRFGLLIALP